MGNFRFRKAERLSRDKWISNLFANGAPHFLHPLKFIVQQHPDPSYPVTQVLFSVPRRQFKKASDRNLLKRRMREGYRLHKHLLPSSEKWAIAYIYVGKGIVKSEVIHSCIEKSLVHVMQNQ